MSSPEAPRWAVRVAAWLMPARYREPILDDLAEVWPRELARQGARAARRWYWKEILAAVVSCWWQVLRFGRSMRPPSPEGDGALFTLLYDWRRVLRSLRRTPGFTMLTTATLALGIGSTTAVFSLVNAVLLRQTPFKEPDRLVQIDTRRGGERGRISLREIDDLRERLSTAEDVAVYVPGAQYSVAEGAAPEKATAILASHNLFAVLGVPLLHGAAFPPSSDRERHNAIVLGHGLWRRQFGGDPAVVGRRLAVDATPGVSTPAYIVEGVMPEGFDFPARTDVYRSLYIHAAFPDRVRRDARNGIGIIRLKPGVPVERARDELAAISRQLAREFPATNEAVTLTLTPLGDVYAGPVRPYLLVLLAAAATLLVIACVNVANLLLSRGLDRQGELAVRRALGASRARILGQLALEGGTLALAGGALGILLAHLFVTTLGRLIKLDLPVWMTVSLDLRVLVFTLVLSVLVGLVAAVLPALRAVHARDSHAIRSAGSRAIGSVRQRRLRRTLMAGEIAVSLLLLVGAGLMLQTFRALWQTDAGFAPGGLLTFRVGLPVYYGADRTRQFVAELVERLEALPGARGAAVNNNLPLAQVAQADRETFAIEGQDAVATAANPYANYQRVSQRYFEVMNVPILTGRGFDARDRHDTAPVAIISRRLAQRYWPDRDPAGARLRRPGVEPRWLTIVGVAADVRHESLTAAEGFDIYVPAAQSPDTWNHVVVRVAQGDPMRLADAARRAVQAINPMQPVSEMQAMRDRMLDTAWQQRASAFILGVFALLALSLATVGIYGVTAYTVGQRRREFGVRRALGARPVDLAFVVLRDVGRTTAAGLVAGLVLALLAGRAVRPLLVGVAPFDAPTFAGAGVLLAAVALLAALVPAGRAARIDPIVTLKSE